MTCSTANAATAATAMVTKAILLTSEPTPGAWLMVLAASRRPGAGPPDRISPAMTANPFAARAGPNPCTVPRIATTRSFTRPAPRPLP
jgi:hypothetical protein